MSAGSNITISASGQTFTISGITNPTINSLIISEDLLVGGNINIVGILDGGTF